MTTNGLERDGVVNLEDPEKEIRAHLAYIDRLRGPVTVSLILEMLEKSVFKLDDFTQGLKPRLFLVYLKYNSDFLLELKELIDKGLPLVGVIEQVKPIIIKYVTQLMPHLFDQIFWEFITQKYEDMLDDYAHQLPQYLLRISQAA